MFFYDVVDGMVVVEVFFGFIEFGWLMVFKSDVEIVLFCEVLVVISGLMYMYEGMDCVVFDGLFLCIEFGSVVVFVGYFGGGKMIVLLCLFGFIDFDFGFIFVGDCEFIGVDELVW